jgi:hypothetical protein
MSDEPVVGFKLEMVGRLNPAKVRSAQSDNVSDHRRQDQEAYRKAMVPYFDEMILGMVHEFRTATDVNIKFRIFKEFANRIMGMPRAVSEEERKGADAHSLLDVLAAFSGNQAVLERGTTETPAVQHKPTIDNDASTASFFEELDRSRQGDDIVDGEIVSD